MQYLKEYGAQLVALGYSVIPVPLGTKGPRKPGWQKIKATPELIDKWIANGSAADGIGILAAHTPAIDIDIMDAQIANRMLAIVSEQFGEVQNIRVGMAPKILIPFRCGEPFKKLSSSTYYDALTDTRHKVEILADGQQWVAYHEHPETKQPYEWTRGGLLDLPRDQLPVLSVTSAQGVINAFERVAAGLVASGQWGKVQSAPPEPVQPAQPVDLLLNWKPHINFDTLKSALSKIPNKGRDELEYDQWRDIIFAIHRETNGQDHGLRLAHAWSARASKYDASFLDDRVWPYVKDNQANPITGLTILKRAREHGWLPSAPRAAVAHSTDEDPFPQYAADDYQQGYESIPWIAKGIIPRAQFGVLYGGSGGGKTFLALDIGAAVARGDDWHGYKTNAGAVVYVAAEAGAGIKKRLAGYAKTFGSPGPNLRIMPSAPDLLNELDAPGIIMSTNLRGGASLIIIDTLAASHNGDENSSQDMGRVITQCKHISDGTGAMVLLVHHTGKDDAKGMRGSSALFAAADVVLEVSGDVTARQMKVVKQKDGELGSPIGFTLEQIHLSPDQDGDPITTCVVRPSDIPIPEAVKKLSELQEYIVDTFDQSIGLDTNLSNSMSEEELVEAVLVRQIVEQKPVSVRSVLRRSIRRATSSLVINSVTCRITRV